MDQSGSTIPRCEHGSYLPPGQTKSHGCQWCNPTLNSHPLSRPTPFRGVEAEHIPDTFQLIHSEASRRLAQGFALMGAE
jgi:hypothetical protein